MNDSQMTLAPRARRSDRATSHLAAASVTEVNRKQRAVLAILRIHGPLDDRRLIRVYSQEPLAPDQSESGIRTRRCELVRMGLVAEAGEVLLPSGRKATLWKAVAR